MFQPDVTQHDVLEILLRHVRSETDKPSPDLACPEPGCSYLADTYQLLQRHYLSRNFSAPFKLERRLTLPDVFYPFPCPFCSRKLDRVSQVDSHMRRCSSRDQRVIPEKYRKRKLDAYSELRRAQKNKKRQVLALNTSNFSNASNTAIRELHLAPTAASIAHSLEEPWQQMRDTVHSGMAVNDSALMLPLDQQLTLLNTTRQDLAPELMRDLPGPTTVFSPTQIFAIAPSLIDNFAAGCTPSGPYGQTPRSAQHSAGKNMSSAPKQLYSNHEQELAPGLINNFADGATTFISIQQDNPCPAEFDGNSGPNTMPLGAIPDQTGRAPGLIDNFADGTATYLW